MLLANGCSTVNNGEVKTLRMNDPVNILKPLQVEVVKHNKDYKIIAYYMTEKTKTGETIKTEVTLYKNLVTKEEGSEVYKFKSLGETKHYWSRNYKKYIRMPKKYYTIVQYLHKLLREQI